MRLATWNVESIRAHHDQVLDWIDRHEVEVLCMQETRADARRFPRQAFEQRGFDLVVHGGEGGRGGVAIASTLPLEHVVLGIPGAVAPLDEPRSISVDVGGLRLHTCYAPNGRKVGTDAHAQKLAWLALLAAWIGLDADDDAGRSVLVGDLNVAPTDADVWDASRYRRRNLTSPPERAAFERLLDQAGLVDAVRRRIGDRRAYTWWNRRSDFYATDRGWRLDHVLVAPAIDERIRDLDIDRAERGRAGAADHAPTLIDLR